MNPFTAIGYMFLYMKIPMLNSSFSTLSPIMRDFCKEDPLFNYMLQHGIEIIWSQIKGAGKKDGSN